MTLKNLVVTALLLIGTSVAANAQSITNGNFATNLSGWTIQSANTQWLSELGPDSLPGRAPAG